MSIADDPLFIPDDLLALATPEQLALYERILAREAAELPDAPQPLPDSPGALAARITNGEELQAPHLNLIDEIHLDCRTTPNARHVLSIAPRLGKTQRGVRWAVPWHLMHDPWARFLYVTYGRDLSAISSRWIRDMLDSQDLRAVVKGVEHRIHPRRDVRSVTEWELADFPDSGMIAVGLDGPLTGKGGHLICDDLIKNATEADSKAAKETAYKALTETLMPRVDEGCFAFIIMARWAEDDPIGRLMVDDPNGWNFVNVPELCEDPVTDPIGRRAVGDPICTALRSLERSLHLRATLPRFEGQYQGHPENVKRTGGIFARDKIDRNRWAAVDRKTLVRVAVGVDPSASDAPDSDEAGIIAAAKTLNGHYPVLEDRSGRMEPDRWARVALLTCLRWDADVLVYESNLVKQMMGKVIDRAWTALVADLTTLRAALELANSGEPEPLDLLLHGQRVDGEETWEHEPMPDAAELMALLAEPDRRLVKPRLQPVPAKVGKELRAEPVSQLYAQDLVHHVGPFPALERQETTWRPGQGSPDRMDACVTLGTLIVTDSGIIPVERVTVDHKVLTREGYRRVVWSGVARTADLLVEITTRAGTLRCTPDHRVWTVHRGWVEACDLALSDWLAGPDNPEVGILRLTGRSVEPQPVYDLTVEDVPEFYADGLLVHNCVHVLTHLADLSLDAGVAAPTPAALPKPSIGGASRRGGMNLGGFGRPAGR